MALTFIEYTADGNNNKNFTFPSITTTDVDVKLDGVLQTCLLYTSDAADD